MASVYRFLQRHAHESPVIFYSLALGFLGPAMVLTVPPIRRSWGWEPAERIPTTFPREPELGLGWNRSPGRSLTLSPAAPRAERHADAPVPNRPRRAVSGYEDA